VNRVSSARASTLWLIGCARVPAVVRITARLYFHLVPATIVPRPGTTSATTVDISPAPILPIAVVLGTRQLWPRKTHYCQHERRDQHHRQRPHDHRLHFTTCGHFCHLLSVWICAGFAHALRLRSGYISTRSRWWEGVRMSYWCKASSTARANTE